MKLFILTNCHTPNERGALGFLSTIKIFNTYEEAYAELKEEAEEPWVTGNKEIFEHRLQRETTLKPGESRLRAFWGYECYIDGMMGYNDWHITEYEVPKKITDMETLKK